jgi:hypothetical protein
MSSEECEIFSTLTINILILFSFLIGFVVFKQLKVKKEKKFNLINEKMFNVNNFYNDHHEVGYNQ